MILDYIRNLNPIDSLLFLMIVIAIIFLFVVIYLDNNENFALKRDWRK